MATGTDQHNHVRRDSNPRWVSTATRVKSAAKDLEISAQGDSSPGNWTPQPAVKSSLTEKAVHAGCVTRQSKLQPSADETRVDLCRIGWGCPKRGLPPPPPVAEVVHCHWAIQTKRARCFCFGVDWPDSTCTRGGNPWAPRLNFLLSKSCHFPANQEPNEAAAQCDALIGAPVQFARLTSF